MQRLRRCCKNLPQRYPQAKQHSRKGKLLFPCSYDLPARPRPSTAKKNRLHQNWCYTLPQTKEARDGIQPDHQRSPGRERSRLPHGSRYSRSTPAGFRPSTRQPTGGYKLPRRCWYWSGNHIPVVKESRCAMTNAANRKTTAQKAKNSSLIQRFPLYVQTAFYLLPQGRSYTIRSSVEMTSCQPSASKRASASVPWLTMA